MKRKREITRGTVVDGDKSRPSHVGTLLRLSQVLARFPVGRSTWYAGVREGTYPKPVPISSRAVAWPSEEIDKLIRRYMHNRRV
jgi:prophage regulatory protein